MKNYIRNIALALVDTVVLISTIGFTVFRHSCCEITFLFKKNPVIASDQPFGKYSDSSLIWGPVTGMSIYMGIRYTLK